MAHISLGALYTDRSFDGTLMWAAKFLQVHRQPSVLAELCHNQFWGYTMLVHINSGYIDILRISYMMDLVYNTIELSVSPTIELISTTGTAD